MFSKTLFIPVLNAMVKQHHILMGHIVEVNIIGCCKDFQRGFILIRYILILLI